MRELSQKEKKFYLDQGYVVLPGFFPAEEMAELNEEMDQLEKTQDLRDFADADHGGFMLGLGLRSERAGNFAADERILNIVGEVVYPGISLFSSKLVSKLPHSDTVCHWHQDEAYYYTAGESKVRMSIWVPLSDATKDNGCLWVVPESHKQGLQPFQAQQSGSCRLALTHEADLSKAIPLEVKAGSLVLFSALLWHGSRGNTTAQPRRAFIVSYQEATNMKGNGKQWRLLRPAEGHAG